VQVSEGYVLTPQGDEVYIPPNAAPYDIQQGVVDCLQLEPPCPEPGNLEDERPVRIMRGNIDPAGKDIHRDYNREWLQIRLLRDANLNGYVVQHTINPGRPNAAFSTYYTFREQTIFPAGTVIRIHSGAQASHSDPEPGVTHRYVAEPGQLGNWRLNNQRDIIRVLDVAGGVVDTREVERPVVYLAVYARDQESCPQPAVPEKCQPPGGRYEFSRIREEHRFDILCALPPSHQLETSCETLADMVCNRALIACPPAPEATDNGVILAAITVSEDGVIEVDNQSIRRQLLSLSAQQAYLHCQCQGAPPVGRITAIEPGMVQLPGTPLTLNAAILGEGLAGATQVLFAGSGLQAQVTNNTDPARLEIVLNIASDVTAGQYGFFVIFPDSRAALQSVAFNVFLTLQAGTQPTLPTVFTSPTVFTIFTIFTSPTILTQPTVLTQPTLFTGPTLFTLPTLATIFTGPPILTGPPIVEPPGGIDLDPGVFDLDRGRTESIDVVPGVGDIRTRRLREAGITNVLELATTSVERLTQVLGTSAVRAAALQDAARNRMRRA
jgi:hypothetical protein